MRRSKRHFLQLSAAGVLALVVPIAPAQAQGLETFLRALGAISTALGIADLLAKWFLAFAADKRCKVDIAELETIKLNCEILLYSLDDGGRGAIPSLKNFLANKDSHSWQEARTSIGQLLGDGTVLMGNISSVVTKLDASTYPGSKEDIEKLYHGVDNIREAMVILARLSDNPESEDFKLAENVLSTISTFPDLAKAALRQLQITIDDRQELKC